MTLAKLARSLAAETNDAAADAALVRNAPHNLEAEQALLGAVLVNNEAIDRVTGFLEAGHFYDPLHASIFETMGKLIHMGKQATPVTLRTFFENSEPLGEITVPQYLGRLAANATTIINAHDYGRTIYDLAVRRQLILIGEDLVNTAYDSPVDNPPKEQIEEAEQRLFEVADKGKYGKGFDTFSSALVTAIDMAGAAYLRDGGLSGIATGLRDLDGKMGGLQSSDLIIIAGRPSMGKTALVTNIAFNVAKKHKTEEGTGKTIDGAVVGFFSLEMSSEQLATRILAEQAEISSENIRRGKITEDEFRRLKQASIDISTIPLYIDQTGGITLAQLTARARKLKRQRNVGLIIVDYLQLITGSSKNSSDNRVQEITQITTGLKALAKELQVPVIALSQLSRAVEQREDKRPQLSDLRESGSIEQDADVVMFVFREEYYVQRAEPSIAKPEEYAKWQQEMERTHGIGEVIIGKQRHGPTGTVRLTFQGQFTRFGDLAHDAAARYGEGGREA